jgi:flagellar biosynthesis/type III secretory pathway protein FliH
MTKSRPRPYEAKIPFRSTLRGLSIGGAADSVLQAETNPQHDALVEQLAALQKDEREKLQRVLASVEAAAQDLIRQQALWRIEMQQAAVKLSVAIASKLIHGQLEAGDFPIEEIIHQVVARLATTKSVTVRLHPEDLAMLEHRLGARPFSALGGPLELLSDPSLERGACRAQAGDIRITSSLRDQLAEMDQLLTRKATCHS